MTILFDARRPVKSARRFGAGILPTRPTYVADHTADDDRWLIEDNARRELLAECDRVFPRIGPTAEFKAFMRTACEFVEARMENELLDALYTDRRAEDALSCGYESPDVEAAELAEAGCPLVGHAGR